MDTTIFPGAYASFSPCIADNSFTNTLRCSMLRSYLDLTGITFTGQLVYASGLYRSTAYDSHIFDETSHEHP